MADSIRSDARRNRERLLEVATEAFTTADARPVSLESIARDAGVGIGTLYRHFPSREALIAAVYRAELAEVAAAAGSCSSGTRPKPPCVAGWTATPTLSPQSAGWPSH